jgi:hypothetical protein
MNTIRNILATITMLIASFFKILTVAIAPDENKQEFKDSI